MSSAGERALGLVRGARDRARSTIKSGADSAARKIEDKLSARRSSSPKASTKSPKQPKMTGPVNGAAGVRRSAGDTGIPRSAPKMASGNPTDIGRMSAGGSKPKVSTPSSAQRRRNRIKALQPKRSK